MNSDRRLILYHAPYTRSAAVLTLLEELGIDYEMKLVNLRKSEQRQPDYLAVNPMGKVPAIKHGDAVVTEQTAIYLYLADTFSLGRLAPLLDSPLRGPYLKWIVFYAACFEAAMEDFAAKHKPVKSISSPYGDYDRVVKTVAEQLAKGPYLLGEEFTAADVLWGGALEWTTETKLVPELSVFMAYVKRMTERPHSGAASRKTWNWRLG